MSLPNVKYETKSKNSFELALIIVFILLSQPFLFNVYLGPEVSYLICGVILVILAISGRAFSHFSSKLAFILIGLFIYALVSFIFNTEYVFYTLLTIFDLLFFIVVIGILRNNVKLRFRLLAFSRSFAVFVSLMIIAAHFLYLYYPGAFSHTDDFAGYHGFFNPIFGMVNDDKLRPCWYFAEPSYSGFFLGFNFLMSLKQEFKSRSNKLLTYAVLLAGIFFTSSTGAYVYLLVSLLVYLGTRISVSKWLVQLVLYGTIVVALFVIPKIDSYGLLTLAVERNEASFLSRQNRMDIANETKESMSFGDKLIGKGASYVTVKYEEGLSDAYNKLYVEYGLLFMFVFLWFVRKMTVRNLPLHSFVFLSFLSVVICMVPINLVCYYLVDPDNN